MDRRSLFGLAGFLAMPAIVKTPGLLMPVAPLVAAPLFELRLYEEGPFGERLAFRRRWREAQEGVNAQTLRFGMGYGEHVGLVTRGEYTLRHPFYGEVKGRVTEADRAWPKHFGVHTRHNFEFTAA